MKLVSALFLVLLLHAHGLPAEGDPLARPLSLFRDGPHAWLGYMMFAALVLAGLLYTAALVRSRREGEAAVSALALLLLLVIAATPSMNGYHLLCSGLLLLLLFGHYALLLYRAGGPWWLVHLTIPVALLLATRFHSYGAWQKALVLYFLAAAVVHHHLLGREVAVARRHSTRATSWGRGPSVRRRKVYQLHPGREWRRL